MKSLLKYFFSAAALILLVASCDKVHDLPFYKNGNAAVLSSSVTTVAAVPSDSLKEAVTFSWTSPEYSTDSSNVKYVIEIDSAGRNFSKAVTRTVTGVFSTTFTAKELNTILLSFGFSFNVPYDIEVRLTSSYANNNEQITSNTIKLTATPYKIPPKVALPASGRLFIVGDATDFGWTNDPAPPFPAVREFTKLSETRWAGIFNMKGNGGYKILQAQGIWDTQYHMTAGGNPLAGSFVQENADPAFQSPPAGAYKITLDFQTGTYSLTKVDNALSPDLYITGDATPSSWTNSPPANQKFTDITNGVFEITMVFTPGLHYKFLSINGNWQPQFGGTSDAGGDLGANYGGGNDPAGIPTPAVAGNYKIQVNFLTNTYTVTKL